MFGDKMVITGEEVTIREGGRGRIFLDASNILALVLGDGSTLQMNLHL